MPSTIYIWITLPVIMNDSTAFRLIPYWNHETPFRLILYWMGLIEEKWRKSVYNNKNQNL